MEGVKDYLPKIDHHQFIFVVLLVITIYMIYNFYDKYDKLSTSLLIASAGAMFVFGYRLWQRDAKVGEWATERRKRVVHRVEGGEHFAMPETEQNYRSYYMSPEFRNTLHMPSTDRVLADVKDGSIYPSRYPLPLEPGDAQGQSSMELSFADSGRKGTETLVGAPYPAMLTGIDTDVVGENSTTRLQ